MPGYPIEVELRGRVALVVGLGAVGRRKAEGVLAAGGRVIGVDPAAERETVPDGIELREEPYRAGHLVGVSLAFAAGPPGVNRVVVADARAAGVWVNSASEPSEGDFAVPAVWREGGLTLTVATSGASPALAAALRDRAADALGPDAAGLVDTLIGLRPVVLARLTDPAARRRVTTDWADPRWLVLYSNGGPEAVRAEALRAIDREAEAGDRRGS